MRYEYWISRENHPGRQDTHKWLKFRADGNYMRSDFYLHNSRLEDYQGPWTQTKIHLGISSIKRRFVYSLNNIKDVSSQYSDSATLIIVTVVYIQFKLVQKQSPPSAVECVLYSCPQTGRIKIAVAIYLNFSNPHRRRRNHQYLCKYTSKSKPSRTDRRTAIQRHWTQMVLIIMANGVIWFQFMNIFSPGK